MREVHVAIVDSVKASLRDSGSLKEAFTAQQTAAHDLVTLATRARESRVLTELRAREGALYGFPLPR
ncbi:hypothetical protein DMH01_00035 [Amycolatopsis sp. WAC 04182]|nr:hypothetical protein DMH01_00035 [Amycolatopsis sp. WAC 04182]